MYEMCFTVLHIPEEKRFDSLFLLVWWDVNKGDIFGHSFYVELWFLDFFHSLATSSYRVNHFAFVWDLYYVKVLSYKLVGNTEFVRLLCLYSWVWSQPVCDSCVCIKGLCEQFFVALNISAQRKQQIYQLQRENEMYFLLIESKMIQFAAGT